MASKTDSDKRGLLQRVGQYLWPTEFDIASLPRYRRKMNLMSNRAFSRFIFNSQLQMASVRNLRIQGRHGEIPIRCYRPTSAAQKRTLIFFHGGGFVSGNLRSHDGLCRYLAEQTGYNIIAVQYRLAPEHKFPIPAEDCYDALCWIAAHAAELGTTPDQLAIGGGSAGGNLAAVTCLMARDLNGPAIRAQVLAYPITDGRMQQPSYSDEHQAPFLNSADMHFFIDCYAGNPADIQNPYFSPLLAANLSGLPPALVITAENDPLRDEGRAYAQKLKDAGPTQHLHYENMPHAFLSMGRRYPEAAQAVAEIKRFLDSQFQ